MLSAHVVKGFAMSAFPRSISLLEYQAMDAASEVKSEYFRGEVFAMAGGTPEHSLRSSAASYCETIWFRIRL